MPARRRNFIASTPSTTILKRTGNPVSANASCTSRASPRLSSTRRISSDLAGRFILGGNFLDRDCEEKSRAFIRLRFDPDFSAVTFDDALAHGKPDARASVLVE